MNVDLTARNKLRAPGLGKLEELKLMRAGFQHERHYQAYTLSSLARQEGPSAPGPGVSSFCLFSHGGMSPEACRTMMWKRVFNTSMNTGSRARAFVSIAGRHASPTMVLKLMPPVTDPCSLPIRHLQCSKCAISAAGTACVMCHLPFCQGLPLTALPVMWCVTWGHHEVLRCL